MNKREQIAGEEWEQAEFVGSCERKVGSEGQLCGEPAKELHGVSRGTRGRAIAYCKRHAIAGSLIWRVPRKALTLEESVMRDYDENVKHRAEGGDLIREPEGGGTR